ncbi:hypothetical protein FHS42_002738 [Streptomyces zagrosensis]|uniref:Uncharacterized protein n=1 Tax=Streptomyces zagrosensis TaxID=1042984 RepID=A0A7W9Q8U9_9ACTN|nr:hypothetical protein [Streptomyces zagrosensis]
MALTTTTPADDLEADVVMKVLSQVSVQATSGRVELLVRE